MLHDKAIKDEKQAKPVEGILKFTNRKVILTYALKFVSPFIVCQQYHL